MKIKITIEYDGTKFCGWQKQDKASSVQETLEEAIEQVIAGKEKIILFGAGRTDAGVHALGQVAHFGLRTNPVIERWIHNIHNLSKAINFYLIDSGIVVIKSEIVAEEFHARFSATMRHYEYVILNRQQASPILAGRAWHVSRLLDPQKMSIAAEYFVGTHDLDSFRSSHCSAENSVRSISCVNVSKNDDLITISVSAKSFLHNQVRIMVGTLKMIGYGKCSPDFVKFLLERPDRRNSGETAPPYGLFLKRVDYDPI
ncbi:MAG: tRNA pseudouridine(38-40) synthase TruA [Holosporales bacterium]|jgi:tRNA pseudouridine38-40 synthase|nr:tRNA pseudouridine(38-40) synthase TruA [Holosporales bacterium]